MKLELKHLAPYLPYELKIYDSLDGETFEALNFINESICLPSEQFKSPIDQLLRDSMLKPILRPLSDLTKEIITDNSKEFGKSVFEQSYYNSSLDFRNAIFNEEVPLAAYNLLLKWHFDVFGLIDKGLAISTHDVK